MQIKLNKISQIPAEIFKKLCKDHRFEPTFWDIFKYLLMRCAHFSMLLMRMKPINFIFSKSMYIVSEYQSTSRHQFEQYFNFVQQLTLPVVETRGFTTVLITQKRYLQSQFLCQSFSTALSHSACLRADIVQGSDSTLKERGPAIPTNTDPQRVPVDYSI